MTLARLVVAWSAVFAGGVAVGGGLVFALQDRLSHQTKTIDEPPRQWEATVYLPLADKRDQLVGEERWQRALELFVREFGGATLASEVEGCWRDGKGQLHRERVRPIIVSFEQDRLNDLRRVLAEAGRLLDQEAMYARFAETRVLLLPVEANGSGKEP